MAKAQDEIQHITSRLTYISVHLKRPSSSSSSASDNNNNNNNNILMDLPPKPSNTEYNQIQRDMHRLLILRGMTREDEKVPVDAWEMFLDEFFGPRVSGSGSGFGCRRRSGSPFPCVFASDSASMRMRRAGQTLIPEVAGSRSGGAMREQQRLSVSASKSRVRYQSPLPRPHR